MVRDSRRKQLMDAARMVAEQQAMEAQAKQVLPRGQRFIRDLLQVRPGVKAWREDLERTMELADKFGMTGDVAVMRESLAVVCGIEDRFDRLYCQVLGNDLRREPVFVQQARDIVEKLEKDYVELLAEDKAAEEAQKAADKVKEALTTPADTSPTAPAEPGAEHKGLILLSGKE